MHQVTCCRARAWQLMTSLATHSVKHLFHDLQCINPNLATFKQTSESDHPPVPSATNYSIIATQTYQNNDICHSPMLRAKLETEGMRNANDRHFQYFPASVGMDIARSISWSEGPETFLSRTESHECHFQKLLKDNSICYS